MSKSIRSIRVRMYFWTTICVIASFFIQLPGGTDSLSELSAKEEQTKQTKDEIVCDGPGPCIVPWAKKSADDAPRITGPNAPVGAVRPDVDLSKTPWLVESVNLPVNHPALQRDRMLWADSILWYPIAEVMEAIPVEQWVTPLPSDLAGKYVLVEVWATWCPPCRRSLPYLNFIQEKYKDKLVVVAICETDEKAIRNMPGTLKVEDVKFSMAIDTGRRLANKLHVIGVPHAILLEPFLGGVVWEGMPTLPGYELSDKALERLFAIGDKQRAAGQLPKISPVKFIVKEATDAERATRRKHDSEKNVETAPGSPTLN